MEEIQHFPAKRLFDLLFSLLVVTLGLPIFLLIGLAIFFTSKGAIIYSHERIGRGGRPFRCYKFRTMHSDADERLNKLLISRPELRQEWECTYKLKNDPRITKIGHFLRKTSLDELPQFFNVIKGDLSVVGPRPVTREEIEKYIGHYTRRFLSVRPGITGPWQVSGRNNICYQKRIEMDLDYIQKRNLLKDIALVLKTIPAMISTRGAY